MPNYIKSLILGYRYFYISYSFDGGYGYCWTMSERKGLSINLLVKELEETGITKVTIINFIQISRSQYILDNKKPPL